MRTHKVRVMIPKNQHEHIYVFEQSTGTCILIATSRRRRFEQQQQQL